MPSLRKNRPLPSMFRLHSRDQFRQLRGFWSAYQDRFGARRAGRLMAQTLRRFILLRARISASRFAYGHGADGAPMVGDAVAFAVAMYQTLTPVLGRSEAQEFVCEQIVKAGRAMMASWVPADRSLVSLGLKVREIMDEAARLGVYEIEGMNADEAAIRWDITACQYHELCCMLDAAELATVFCAVDGPFVSSVLPDIPFSCETTLAAGQDRCRFRVGRATSTTDDPSTRSHPRNKKRPDSPR